MKTNNFLKFKNIFFLLLFITGGFFVFGVGEVSAATYYVDPGSGSDSATKIQAQNPSTPTRTIAKVISSDWLLWGDTISLSSGTYNGNLDSGGLFMTGQLNWVRWKGHILGDTANGPLIITSSPGADVTIDMPTSLQGGALFYSYGNFILKGADSQHKIRITNSGSSAANFLIIHTGLPGNVTMQDVVFDWNNTINSYPFYVGNDVTDYSPSMTFNRCEIKNINSLSENYPFLRSQITQDGLVTNVNFYSCLFHDSGYLFTILNNKPVNAIIHNCTFANIQTDHLFQGSSNIADTFNIKNNIFSGSTTFYRLLYDNKTHNQIDSNWTVNNNIFYVPLVSDPGGDLDSIGHAKYGNELFPMDEDNFYIDPQLDSDFKLPAESYVSGRGDISILSNTDINGETWTGADIGAYKNPHSIATFPVITSDTVAFTGDSIAQGSGNRAIANNMLNPVTVVGNGLLGSAIGGSGGQSVKWYIDRAATTWHPEYIIIISYHNNFHYDYNSPSNITAQQAANDIEVAMKKAEYWGMKPIFLGMAGVSAATLSDQTTKSIAFNSAMENICNSHGWSCNSIIDYMIVNPSWSLGVASGGYYQVGGIFSNVHPASEGYDLITRLAEYSLHYKLTIGVNNINIGAGARIYADGKFRDLETANGETADLSITPQSSFNIDDKSHWLDITDITWDDTKEWTESSTNSSLTNTLHTIGDLTPNNYYNVSVDDSLGNNITGTNCTAGICKANSNGKIVFTYTGTYSEHTFKVEAGDNSNPILTNNTNNKFNVKTTSVNLNLTTDENSTCHYSNNSATTFDNGTPFTTTGATSHTSQINNLTSNSYTYYAICRDSNSNESTYTLTFEIAPEELKEDISSPIIKTSQGKEKMKDSTIYSGKKEIKLQGEDIKLANGTIKIYRNSKHIETIEVDTNGKWSKKIELDKDFSGYLKIKQYNQYGTLVSERKTKVKVDNEDPIITIFPKNQTPVTRGKTNLNFLATDNNKVTEYKIYLGGNIYKTKTNSFLIPAKTNSGLQYLRIRAYDKAGNSSYKETFILVR